MITNIEKYEQLILMKSNGDNLKNIINDFLICKYECIQYETAYSSESYLRSNIVYKRGVRWFRIKENMMVSVSLKNSQHKFITLRSFLKKYFNMNKQGYVNMLNYIGFEIL